MRAVAEYVEAMTTSATARPLSERERALPEQAREDFRLGRTLTLEESKARTEGLLERHRAKTIEPS